MKDAEVIVRCVPIDVALECPYCKEENEYDYSEFCDLCGQPPDWDYEILECQKCGKKFEIQGQEWS